MYKIIKIIYNFLNEHQELILVFIVVVIGIGALIFGVLGEIPNTKLSIGIESRIISGVIGILLVFIGIIFFKLKPVPPPPPPHSDNLPSNGIFEKELSKSGFTDAFRSPVGRRDNKVKLLIENEMKEKRKFRLLAMSGYSYLNPNGPVWKHLKLGEKLMQDEAKIEVVLESPFSPSSFTRALANQVYHTHWEEKQKIDNFVELLQYDRNIFIRVTECPANCSLFLTSRSALYDFYLWSRPSNRLCTTENNFIAFEISKVDDSYYDCYELLDKHFNFLWNNSIPLEEFLHSPDNGGRFIYGREFYDLHNCDKVLALNKYNKNNKEFKKKMQKILSKPS